MAGESGLVLVVEDEALIAMNLEAISQEAGYRVAVANSVAVALKMTSQERPKWS
jgi:DNA-binding response OmpR family regulator